MRQMRMQIEGSNAPQQAVAVEVGAYLQRRGRPVRCLRRIETIEIRERQPQPAREREAKPAKPLLRRNGRIAVMPIFGLLGLERGLTRHERGSANVVMRAQHDAIVLAREEVSDELDLTWRRFLPTARCRWPDMVEADNDKGVYVGQKCPVEMSGRRLVPFALDQPDRVAGRILDDALEMPEIGKYDVVEEALDSMFETCGVL